MEALQCFASFRPNHFGGHALFSRPCCCRCLSQPNNSGVITSHLATLQRGDSDETWRELTYLVDPIITHFSVATFDHCQRQQAWVCQRHQVMEMNTGCLCEVEYQGMCHEPDDQQMAAKCLHQSLWWGISASVSRFEFHLMRAGLLLTGAGKNFFLFLLVCLVQMFGLDKGHKDGSEKD